MGQSPSRANWEVIGGVCAVLGVIIGLGAWWFPTQADGPPAQTSIDATILDIGKLGLSGVLQSGPGYDSRTSYGVVKTNEKVVALCEAIVQDSSVWVKVRNTHGQTGFVVRELLEYPPRADPPPRC